MYEVIETPIFTRLWKKFKKKRRSEKPNPDDVLKNIIKTLKANPKDRDTLGIHAINKYKDQNLWACHVYDKHGDRLTYEVDESTKTVYLQKVGDHSIYEFQNAINTDPEEIIRKMMITIIDPDSDSALKASCYGVVAHALKTRREPTDYIVLLGSGANAYHGVLMDKNGNIVVDSDAEYRTDVENGRIKYDGYGWMDIIAHVSVDDFLKTIDHRRQSFKEYLASK